MKRVTSILGAAMFAIGALIGSSAYATPANTVASASVAYEMGQGWVTQYFDESNQTRWFRYTEVGGHSFCLEAVQGSLTHVQLDPALTVYTDTNGTTTLVANSVSLTNDNGTSIPAFIKGSRICYIAPTALGVLTTRAIKLNVPITANSGDAGHVRFRIVDTTLTAAGVGYYVHPEYPNDTMQWAAEISNVTPTALKAQLTYAPSTTTVNSYVFDMGAFATSAANGTAPQSMLLKGPVFLAHNGPPGAIKGVVKVVVRGSVVDPITSRLIVDTVEVIALQPR